MVYARDLYKGIIKKETPKFWGVSLKMYSGSHDRNQERKHFTLFYTTKRVRPCPSYVKIYIKRGKIGNGQEGRKNVP